MNLRSDPSVSAIGLNVIFNVDEVTFHHQMEMFSKYRANGFVSNSERRESKREKEKMTK